jgi:hypothetical protein
MADFSYIGPGRKIESSPYGFTIQDNSGAYYDFVPKSVFEKGIVKDSTQYYFPNVLTPNFSDQLLQNSRYITTESVKESVGKDFAQDLKKYGFDDEDGFLFQLQQTDGPYFTSWIDQNIRGVWSYKINDSFETDGLNVKRGPITGISSYQGQPVFLYDTAGSSGPVKEGWISYDPETGGGKPNAYWFVPGKTPSWVKPAKAIGYGLIGIGTLGLAGLGPLAAGSGAAAGGASLGTGITAGAGGATGLTAGAAGATGLAAPAGFTFAPTVGAAGAGIAAGSQLGTGITPGAAGQGLQLPTAPGLSEMGGGTGLLAPVEGGMVSQLGFVPAGATPVLGDPKSFINDPNVLGQAVLPTQAAGMSVTDALRLANQARGLLGAGQNPAVQQGMPGQQAGQRGAVDYSGVLGLLQQQARTPGVSSLTAPAQLMPRYQPTLLPNVLSLLG